MADLLKQVSDPTRLQVLMLLSEKERNVSELCTDLGTQSQPAVSHHLALLRHGRLIEPRRSGKHNFYGLTDGGRELAEVVQPIIALIRGPRSYPPGTGTKPHGVTIRPGGPDASKPGRPPMRSVSSGARLFCGVIPSTSAISGAAAAGATGGAGVPSGRAGWPADRRPR